MYKYIHAAVNLPVCRIHIHVHVFQAIIFLVHVITSQIHVSKQMLAVKLHLEIAQP